MGEEADTVRLEVLFFDNLDLISIEDELEDFSFKSKLDEVKGEGG